MAEAANPDAATPSIRPAHLGGAAAIRGLVTEAYAGYAAQVGRTPSPVRDDYARRIAASEVWVLEHGGEITGVIDLKEEPDRLVIANVAVKPAAQDKGFGRALIAFAAEEARQRGFGALRFSGQGNTDVLVDATYAPHPALHVDPAIVMDQRLRAEPQRGGLKSGPGTSPDVRSRPPRNRKPSAQPRVCPHRRRFAPPAR